MKTRRLCPRNILGTHKNRNKNKKECHRNNNMNEWRGPNNYLCLINVKIDRETRSNEIRGSVKQTSDLLKSLYILVWYFSISHEKNWSDYVCFRTESLIKDTWGGKRPDILFLIRMEEMVLQTNNWHLYEHFVDDGNRIVQDFFINNNNKSQRRNERRRI